MTDDSHENTEELTSSRRTALKQIGALGALSSIGISGVAAANDGSKKKPDTNFDPKSEEEVKRFIEILRTMPERERLKLADRLSKAQQRTIFEGLAPARIEVESLDGSAQSSDVTVQASQAYEHAAVKAYSALGFLVWKFHHEILWNYDYWWVSNITSNAYPTDVDPTWSYDGITSQYVRNEESFFDAFKQGGFHFCAVGGYFCGYYTYPYIEWRGYNDGTGTVLRDSCDCPDGGFET